MAHPIKVKGFEITSLGCEYNGVTYTDKTGQAYYNDLRQPKLIKKIVNGTSTPEEEERLRNYCINGGKKPKLN